MPAHIHDWLVLAGRLHPLIVHLPIGIVLLAALLECLTFTKRYANLRQSLTVMWLVAAVTSVLACVAGLILAREGGYEENVLLAHQWLGVSVAVLSIASYLTKAFAQHVRVAGFCITLTSVVVLSLAGHYGGSLTHGEEFLSEPLRIALGADSARMELKIIRKPVENIEDAIVYSDLIAPLLKQKCYTCHSTLKQKGNLRLDTYEHITKGGKSGPAFVAGHPEKSELYKRLLLSIEDKKRMPPKGKTQLTSQEIDLIQWWIEQGNASADKKVGQVSKPETIKIALAQFTKPKNPSDNSELPDLEVREAADAQIAPLENVGIIVKRLSAESPFLSISCVNAEQFNDIHSPLLMAIKDQVVWLKLGHSKITDVSLDTITQLPHVTRLGLEYTAITDNGVRRLQKLSRLQYLNLVGTRVTDSAIPSIIACKQLKALYLWQTLITPAGVRQLRKALPGTVVDNGISDNVSPGREAIQQSRDLGGRD